VEDGFSIIDGITYDIFCKEIKAFLDLREQRDEHFCKLRRFPKREFREGTPNTLKRFTGRDLKWKK
jgi:hypothetical protein